MDCLQECKYRFRCQSVNYLWSFHLCELNYKDTDDGQVIETRPGSVSTSVSQWTDVSTSSVTCVACEESRRCFL
ncbi:hypothetical protein FSP39_000884 [Pinctada imbricata]|uniref:Apple domain-containing protein n=1 Tax=Pinctada imbricata TaxID=66713 RepID=A0AA88XCG0_PINIB|nr:hypothetical protein FSP39_000884 [Pinctada imbricata]